MFIQHKESLLHLSGAASDRSRRIDHTTPHYAESHAAAYSKLHAEVSTKVKEALCNMTSEPLLIFTEKYNGIQPSGLHFLVHRVELQLTAPLTQGVDFRSALD